MTLRGSVANLGRDGKETRILYRAHAASDGCRLQAYLACCLPVMKHACSSDCETSCPMTRQANSNEPKKLERWRRRSTLKG